MESIESLADKLADAIKGPQDIKTFLMIFENSLYENNGPKAIRIFIDEVKTLEYPELI